MNDRDKLADKLNTQDKSMIEHTGKDAMGWIDGTLEGEKEHNEDELKEVQAVCDPIITQVCQGSGNGSGASEGDVMEDLF